MTHSNAKLEIVIVGEADVRLYAENRLPLDQREVIEETLLDDDRARRVVQEHARPIHDMPIEPSLQKNLQSMLKTCGASVVNYELLSRASGPETIVKFGLSRFTNRWALLDEMTRASNPSDDLASVATLKGQPADALDIRDIVTSAARNDSELADALHKAFEATRKPAWKAQIAEWISNIESDIGQIAWLASVFATNRNSPIGV